nr:flagellar hook-length control protein FliK [Methylomarinum sp. Ch1-1]MDP4520735.1 flagellar hook-length control protein FliK [Methylomarinum sp. Ch1-1]
MQQLPQGQRLQMQVTVAGAEQLTGMASVVEGGHKENVKTPQMLTLSDKQFVTSADGKQPPWATAKPGQLITLEAVKSGDQVQLKIVQNNTATVTDQVVHAALKRYLPQQEPAGAVINQLIRTLPALEKNEQIPQTLKRLARQILQQLPQRSQLTQVETLKQQIALSGRFLESHLIQDKTDIDLQQDFKLRLLKLIDQLQQQTEPKTEQKLANNELNMLKALLQKSTQSLARVIVDQLQTLPKEEGNKQVWMLELPFIDDQQANQVTIAIEQEKNSAPAGQKNGWSVKITVTPPELGTIQCKISYYDNLISTRFWSESSATVAKIDRQLDYLKQQFEKNGLKPGPMEVQQGKPEQTSTPLPGKNLLNEKV